MQRPALAETTEAASPSPTLPSEPPLPAAVKVRNQAGAEAAFRYWVQTYTYGFATGNGIPMRSIVTPACKFCMGVIDDIADLSQQGERYIDGEDQVVEIISRKFGGPDSYLLRVLVNQSGSVRVDRSGQPVSTDAAHPRVSFDAKVIWDVDRWRVDKAAVVKE